MANKSAIATASRGEFDEQQVIRPKLHHVGLKTRQPREMVEWYCTVLGGELQFQDATMSFVSNDDANHRMAFATMPALVDDPEKVTRTGMHHTAFEYETLDGLLSTYLRLKAADILPGACLDHGLTTSFYYIDPDGNDVELQADNYGDWAESTEFMRTDQNFVANPIGAFLDPEALVEARRQGMSPWETHVHAWAGDYPPQGPVDLRMPL
jgi:catechol 2,3-dioxygenase